MSAVYWSPANPERDSVIDVWSAASQKDKQDVLSVLAMEATKARGSAEKVERLDAAGVLGDLVRKYRARAASFDAAVNVLRGAR